MAWAYSDWRSQTTTTAQLARLALHMEELTDAVGKELDADGKHVSSNAIQQLLASLEKTYQNLERRSQRSTAGMTVQVRMRDPDGSAGACCDNC